MGEASGRGRWILAALAGAVAVAGPVAGGGHAWATTTVSPPASYDNMVMAPDCSSDATQPMQAWLQQLPSGTTVNLAGACYQIDHGLKLRFVQNFTIENGTFHDQTNTPSANKGHGTPRGVAVIDVLGGVHITLENLTFVGNNHGGYHAKLAFQAAIELDGTINAVLSGLTISKTFGDGINLEPLRGASDHKSGQIVNPSENIAISNVVIRGAGRQGITLASVNGVTISNVTMTNIATDAFDFEADQNNEGAKNVIINGCSYSQLLNISMQGPQTGPITVENCVMPEADSGWAVNIKNTTGHPDAGPIVFDHDVFNCGASAYVACFDLNGATNFMVENSTGTIGYVHDQIHEHAYRAINNTSAAFTDDNVSGYGILGSTAPGSTVSIVGGVWSPKRYGPTATALTQTTDTVAYGSENSDTFAATVEGGKSPAPTGTVTIADVVMDTPICVANLVPGSDNTSAGSCTATTDEFVGGTAFADVAATYYGDGNYTDSQSAPLQTFAVGLAPTSTTLSQSSGTVAYGSENADTFTTTVAERNGDAAPSGTFDIEDTATLSPICSGILAPGPGNSSTGSCSPTGTQFPPGTSFTSVTATDAGDGNNAGSASGAQTFAVGPAPTTTMLDQSTDTVTYGSESADTFVTTVPGQVAGIAPSGTIEVEDTATASPICSATLVADPDNFSTATCSPLETQFPAGTSFTSVTAIYGGDHSDAGSSSAPAQTFSVTPSPTTTALSQSDDTVTYGSESADTFVTTVTEQDLDAAPSGTIGVVDSDTLALICTATLVANPDNSSTGTCSPTDTEFPNETNFTSVTATYGGDGNNQGSASSPPQTFAVGPAPTTTTLGQSSDTVADGSESSDTFTVTVLGQVAEIAPTGTISVEDTATMSPICTATLEANPGSSSTGTCSPTDEEFPNGTTFSSVTAFYGGDGNNQGSVSPPQTFTVGPAPTTTTLVQSNDTVPFGSESSDTFTATVVGQVAGVAPSGTISVDDTDTMSPICTATLVANPDNSSTGTCTPDDTEFASGTSFTSVTATYGGDGTFAGSLSDPAQSFDVTDPGSGGPDRRSAGAHPRRAAVRWSRHPR